MLVWLLQLAWMYSMSLLLQASGGEIARGLMNALLAWSALVGVCTIGALSLLGYVVAALCRSRQPRTTR